ncbi:hypothetical protein SmJEL517_g04664 [Synchytrium microbalum]|uniref:Cytoplasmic dynein 2 heavy chain 1 n=1 Tax=Synchytrium microbalum TaxID=1806994 RepID=A0A507C278_9FUNG|nr:uncharacterized protein SmJEL517_g04664 [Synchytrium microbalum]TPX32194.1 hypothetical protein SmJEL517_g04664 [Synchytrium microbalum]
MSEAKTRQWLQQVATLHLGLPIPDFSESAEVSRFIHDPESLTLSVVYDDKTLQLSNSETYDEFKPYVELSKLRGSTALDSLTPQNRGVIFIKAKKTTLRIETLPEIITVLPFVGGNPALALHRTIKTVIAPLLLKNSKWGINSKLQTLLSDMEGALGGMLQNSNENGIVDDELQYWTDQAADSPKKERSRAESFCDSLKQLKIEMDRARDAEMNDLLSVVENAQDAIDDLWRQMFDPPFPQLRMDHLLDVVTDTFVSIVKERLNAINIGKSDFQTFLEIRVIHERMRVVLTTEEQRDLKVADSLHSFSKVDILDTQPFADGVWKRAVNQYQTALEPVAQHAGQRLRDMFAPLFNQPSQLLREFRKHIDILRNQIVSREVVAEKDALIAQLIAETKTIHEQFQSKKLSKMDSLSGLPVSVANLLWARQTIAKIGAAADTLAALDDRVDSFQLIASPLITDLKSYEQDQLQDWSDELNQALRDPSGPLALQRTGRLMELDYNTGKLFVNYPDRLALLLREVRHITALGTNVSSDILKTVESASRFYRFGTVLKQVAHFYNTIDQQMLRCQQSMMLQLALEFERLVKSPKGKGAEGGIVTWDSPTEVEAYITRLQGVVDRLTRENRRLRRHHDSITDVVLGLFEVNLVRNQAGWKDAVSSIRDIIVTALTGCNIQNADSLSWRVHWDHQLYKALEHQYRLGLSTMHEILPEIRVELVFRQSRLQFRPAIEEVRARYYRELKRFINLPQTFKGVDGAPAIFPLIVERNSASLEGVYRKAEQLFQALLKLQDNYKDWVALGMIGDMDSFVEQHLTEPSHWELNFKAIKTRGKDAESIPISIKVDCFVVSTIPLKASIDDQLQRLFDALVNTLRKTVQGHLQFVEQFVNSAMEVLSQRPQTIAEIGGAHAAHAQLSLKKNEIVVSLQSAESLNKLLRSVAGSDVDATALAARWSKLEVMLDGHDLMIKDQIEVLKAGVEGRVLTLQQEVAKFAARWEQLCPKPANVMGDVSKAREASSFVKDKQREFEDLSQQFEEVAEDCRHFDISATDSTALEALKSELLKAVDAWSVYDGFMSDLDSISGQDWIGFSSKPHSLEDTLHKWQEQIKTRGADIIGAFVVKEIDSYRNILPCIKYLKADGWTAEHWGDLFRIAGINAKGVTAANLTAGQIFAARESLVSHLDEIKELNVRARGEIQIREALSELEVWGASTTFSISEYIDVKGKRVGIIKDWKEIISQIGDCQSLLQSLKDTPYYKNFADQCGIWERKFGDLDACIHDLNLVQRKWVYLEPVFNRGALPSEQARFGNVDNDFRSIMSSIARDTRVVALLSYPSVRRVIATMLDQLERCQKALADFLEQKRRAFARFYFIGDDDLLEILGQATNLTVIQQHFRKLYMGVQSVKFDQEGKHILAMCSSDGEVIPLQRKVKITADIEIWLREFTNEMKSTLRDLVIRAVKAESGLSVLQEYPAQVACMCEFVRFSTRCEKAISRRELPAFHAEMSKYLESLTSFDTGAVAQDIAERGVLDIRIKSVIMDVIHLIDVIEQLVAAQVESVDDWAWQRQLRFYLGKDGAMYGQMVSARFAYTYEYQGTPQRLVHTPLTDKCYLTLTQGMAAGFGGNPFGPAGTGKTESVKALGALMGRQVLVFNCDEGLDYKSMGRIFVGIVKCGAWGCFDEFNRLEESVLSAAALKSQQSTFILMDQQVEVDSNAGIFVTLNPAGKGYGGRQKLPDNLKQLFRSVAMAQPDNELIAETMLFADGFRHAKVFGRKIVTVFKLCQQVLSHMQHYDWGLRPLKSCLRLAGQLLRDQLVSSTAKRQEVELLVIVQSIRANTVPKLTFADATRFLEVLRDTFGQTVDQGVVYKELTESLKVSCRESGLLVIDSQIQKMCELYEALRQRTGAVVVGPPSSGKSALWKTLKTALAKCGQKVNTHVMNPKALDRHVLLGHMDMDTRDWTDGTLTRASRMAVKEPLDVWTWIVCDGDVDPEWIEALNSVLDDNRLLTMPSGERIQFGPNVKFLFETDDLRHASPATISRMGMIYLSEESLDTATAATAWVERQDEALRKQLKVWVDEYLFQAIGIIRKKALTVEVSPVALVLQALSHCQKPSSQTEFVLGLIRGIGAVLNWEARVSFACEMDSLAGLPSSQQALLSYVDANGSVLSYKFEKPVSTATEPVVETVEVQHACHVLSSWLVDRVPVLLVGPDGSGKHLTLKHVTSRLRYRMITLHCSAQTRPIHILQRLLQSCVSVSGATGRVLKPKDGDRLVLYLRDINLPKPDKYDTVEVISFLVQLLCYKGFYDSATLDWIGVEGVQVVASVNDGTMKRALPARFICLTHILNISLPTRENLFQVCDVLVQSVLSRMIPPDHKVWKHANRLTETMVRVYDEAVAMFRGPLVVLSPRDLSHWVSNLARYSINPDNVMEDLLEVIVYEGLRIFGDRLTTKDDQTKFETLLLEAIRADWSIDASKVLSSVYIAPNRSNQKAATLQRLSIKDFRLTIAKEVTLYERDYHELSLALFGEWLAFTASIDRVLSHQGGCLLLAGQAGYGRRSATLLSAHRLGMRVITPAIGRNYGIKGFINDLKTAIQAAVSEEEVVFLFEDHQMVDPLFLEIVNGVLTGGQIASLYSKEELDAMLQTTSDRFAEAGSQGSMIEFFVNEARRNLHLVLILDTLNPDFAQRCESNPALLNSCECIRVSSWYKASMVVVTKAALARQLPELSSVEELPELFVSLHNSVASIQRPTPSKLLVTLLETFSNVFKSKRDGLVQQVKYLEGGLKKLDDATHYVDELSQNAGQQQKTLSRKQLEADQSLQRITDAMSNASDQKRELEDLNKRLKLEEVKMVEQKQAIELQLADVEPILRAARESVGEIRGDALTEIRSLRAPPPAVRDVLEGVLRLMGILDTSWNSMKGFLGKRTIKEEILNFDAHSVTKQAREAVAELLRTKPESFDEVAIRRASVAAAPLAAWVKANIQYSMVLDKTAPLENDLAGLTKSLQKSTDRVKKLQEELSEVDRNVAGLRDEFGTLSREAEMLRMGLEKAQRTLDVATSLLSKLDGEGQRWRIQAETFNSQLEGLPTQSLMASAFVTYLGGASESTRDAMLKSWSKLLNLNDFDAREFLASEGTALLWKSQGLPHDALSLQNAVITVNTPTVALLVDPGDQASGWLKLTLAKSNPEIIYQHDPNFSRALELAVRFGKTLIVQDVTDIEPTLYPLLRQEYAKQGPRYVVRLGDKTVDVGESFKLFLLTKDSRFNLRTDALGLVSEINFTTTQAGLADLLLNVVLQHEKPELELERVKLVEQEDQLNLQLVTLQESLLRELATSTGNILENQSLLESLNEAKAKSMTIEDGLNESRKLKASLNVERDKYARFANFGSKLYFAVIELSRLGSMYHFSLDLFLRLINRALSNSHSDREGKESRTEVLCRTLESLVYATVGRALFKADRLAFAYHLIKQLHPNSYDAREWDYLVGTALDQQDSVGAEVPSWVPSDKVNKFRLLQSLPRIKASFSDREGWSRWISQNACEDSFPPAAKQLTPFQQLLIIKTLRPDRLLTSMTNTACEILDMPSLALNPLTFPQLHEESTSHEPILFITTPGADPSEELRAYAVTAVGEASFKSIAMGQGQGDVAIKLLRDAASKGGWILLQNIHLVTSWIPSLMQELATLQGSLSKEFRLFMTSEAHLGFSPALLQSCVKVTVEAPPGLKKNLQRAYDGWDVDFIEKGSVLRAQALFALAWFHATLQERRMYLPQGWTKFYEFSAADLRSSSVLIANMCNEKELPQWKVIHGLLEQAVYGGRVDSADDSRCLRVLLESIFADQNFKVGSQGPSKQLANGLDLPNRNRHADYVQFINGLPDTDSPSLLGLPANIDRSMQQSTSWSVLSQLASLRSTAQHDQVFDRQEWLRDLAPVFSVWKKLMGSSDVLQKPASSPLGAGSDPLVSFLCLEFATLLGLVQRVNDTLSELSQSVKSGQLASEIQRLGTSLLRGETPSLWLQQSDAWAGPESAMDYMKEVVSKTLAMYEWSQASPVEWMKRPVKLSSLVNTRGFLMALRQQSSRKLKLPIDSLQLKSLWGDARSDSPGVIVEGLVIQGCRFDGLKVSECHAEDPSLAVAPQAYFSWLPEDVMLKESISVPLYSNPSRETYIASIQIPCRADDTRWTLAAVALFVEKSL